MTGPQGTKIVILAPILYRPLERATKAEATVECKGPTKAEPMSEERATKAESTVFGTLRIESGGSRSRRGPGVLSRPWS
jgi:hypothetical protein